MTAAYDKKPEKNDEMYGENYFDNCKRMAAGDATTGGDDRKIGKDGIVLETFKDVRSIPPSGGMAPAIGHHSKK